MKKIPRVIAAILAAMLPAGVGGLVAQTGLGADAEFQVNTHTTSYQVFSSVAADDAGNFVVVWESYGQDGSAWGIFGQLYDNAGPDFDASAVRSGCGPARLSSFNNGPAWSTGAPDDLESNAPL